MQRSSIIATVIAAGGVLVAGSVASVAVISASSTPSSESETVNLVAAGAPTEAPPVAQVAAPAPVVTPEAVAPTLEASKLPKIPVVGDDAKPASQPQAQPAAQTQTQTQTQARQPSRQSSSSSKPRPSSSPREVSSSKASSTVVNALGGGTVVSVSKATRGGFSAWAVKVQRTDGSVVTGYVDRATGTAVTVTPWRRHLTRGASASTNAFTVPRSRARHRRRPSPPSSPGLRRPHRPHRLRRDAVGRTCTTITWASSSNSAPRRPCSSAPAGHAIPCFLHAVLRSRFQVLDSPKSIARAACTCLAEASGHPQMRQEIPCEGPFHDHSHPVGGGVSVWCCPWWSWR